VFKELDADKDNRVSRAEFERFCVERRLQIAEVFKSFDRDKDGRVSSDELRRGVERAGLKISDDQLSGGV
jgi:solute carrier family 25 phosphate transporter 23/24/25/41